MFCTLLLWLMVTAKSSEVKGGGGGWGGSEREAREYRKVCVVSAGSNKRVDGK